MSKNEETDHSFDFVEIARISHKRRPTANFNPELEDVRSAPKRKERIGAVSRFFDITGFFEQQEVKAKILEPIERFVSDDTFLPEVSSEGKLQVISQVFAVLRAYNCTKAADSKEDENESHPVKNVDIFYKVSVRALRRGEKAIGFKPRDKRSLAAQGEADKIVPTEDKTGTPSIVDNNGQTWLKDLLARISRKNTKFYAAYAAGFSCAVSEKEDRSTMVFEERIRPALLEFVRLAEKYASLQEKRDADGVVNSGVAVLAETAEQVCAQLSLERQYTEKKLESSIEDYLPTAIAIVNKRHNLFWKNEGGVHLSSWEQDL